MVHVESEVSMSSNMLVTVGLSRYSSGGYTTLVYDGATSTVNERDAVAKAKVVAEVSKNVGYGNVLNNLNIALGTPESAKPDETYTGAIEV
jgi:Na+-translocating ferredoxin:NAD+ oxidoreductase RnfG subunit